MLDIAPETAVQRKAVDRDRYERDLALQARVRDSYRGSGERERMGAPRRRAVQGRKSPPTCSRAWRLDSGCRKRTHFSRAASLQRLRAGVQRRSRRSDTSSIEKHRSLTTYLAWDPRRMLPPHSP